MLCRILIICFFGALNFSASSLAATDTRSDTFSAIKAACAHLDSSLNHQDLPAYADGIDNEFLGMSPQQKDIHGLAEETESLQSLLDQEKPVSCATRLLSLTVYGDGVVTNTEATFTLGSGADAVKRVDTQRRFWVQVNGKWLLKRERLLSRTMIEHSVKVKGRRSAALFHQKEPLRLIEPSGGFSYLPPQGWQMRTFPGLKYHISFTEPSDGFLPNINVVDETSTLPIGKYADLNLSQMKQQLPDFHLLSRTIFVTTSGISGVRIVSNETLMGRIVRQSFYLFPGAGSQKFVLTASWLASDGDKYTETVNAAMKTFAKA